MSAVQDHLPIERNARAREGDGPLSNPEPLRYYRDVHAWVLMGDPGAGKTEVFKSLSKADGGYYTSARDFVALDLPTDWTQPLFIDGFDEVTAGNAGGTVLDQIRRKLQEKGTPRFRISCREADWRGNSDSAALMRLVGDENFAELHLSPLSNAQQVALIAHWQSSNESSATQFIREAESRDLEGLLDNPQTLRMLVKAIGTTANVWPDSKTEAYDMACSQLVREHNDAHLATKRLDPLPDDKLLQAAGYLAALMLLSSSAVIGLQRHSGTRAGIMELPELASGATAPDLPTCRAALQTRLFKSDGNGEFWPVHRTVAEYLGARYVKSRIDAGLPVNRVLALMLGQDGGVVPELRGMHAWLAAIAPRLRGGAIDRDPLGVVVNGDVRNFSRIEKLQVLDSLHGAIARDAYVESENSTSNSFGALATANMMEDFKIRLQSADRSVPHRALIGYLLDALAYGHHMPQLKPELEQVVRDKTYWPGSRKEALKILVAYAGKNGSWSALAQLLADIHGNVVEDLQDELLGTLLQALYPAHVPSRKIWSYFRDPKATNWIGSYFYFWHELPETLAPPDELPVLLDGLLSIGYQLGNRHDHLGSAGIVGELLVRGVAQNGAEVDVQRLWGWLSLGLGAQYYCPLKKQHKGALAQWLEERPDVYKALFEHGLQLRDGMSGTGFAKLWRVRAHLYGAREPDDAEVWYLSLAQVCPDDDLRLQLVREASNFAYQEIGPDAAIRLIEEWSSGHPIDAAWAASQLLCPYPPSALDEENIEFDIKYKAREAEEFRQRISFFRETLPSFTFGPAHLGALVEVANAYLGIHGNSADKTAEARLLELLNGDQEWVQLALEGLRQCLFREDLPSAAEIVDLNVKGQRYNLEIPCLAAMALRSAENPASVLELSATTLETVAAFYLTGHFEEAGWFKQLLEQRHAIVATVMRRLISQQSASEKEHVDGLHSLAHDADYAEVTRQIVPMILVDFPARASTKQLKSLRLLIVAALARLDSATLSGLIVGKLNVKVMDVAQKVYWLTAGVQVAPDLYLDRIQQFVAKTQGRASHLFALIHEQRERGGLQANFSVATQAFLVELLGPRCGPSWQSGTGWVTPDLELGRYIEALISALAGNPDDAATEALARLRERQHLKEWQDALNRAIHDQRVTRRKALFKPASVAQVCATLANLKPANAADLWALVVDHLAKLAHEIRNSSTNDYRQYWAGGKPRNEDDCRDALLSDLKHRLDLVQVSAEPEGRYADEKRADIKVIASPHHIPIEIKRETHRDLWKSISDQLIAKYGRELSSDGYGIYLVFWFSGNLKSVPSDGGAKPKTPQELQKRLAATVPEELRNKIAVLVVDCSKTKPAQSA